MTTLLLQVPPGIRLLLGGIIAFGLTYLLTFGVIAYSKKMGWVEKPTPGKIHTVTRPRLGGVGIFVAFLIVSLVFYTPTLSAGHPPVEKIFGQYYPKELVVYALFILASILTVVVNVYDDIRGMKPLPKLIAQTVAVLILLGPGFHVFHGVLFFGVHNPFGSGELTLFIHEPVVSLLTIPAVIFTWFWITGMMNAVNWLDGLDGLAAGIVAITGLFITIISFMLHQYTIATLSAIFTGAVAGFLPHNWNPARIIMGDSGSQFLGIALAVLSVMGGAKFALMLMVLGIPILDTAFVIGHRLLRGQSPLQRDELPLYKRATHLHYRLLYGGLSVHQVCLVFYGVTFLFGFFALSLPPLDKFLGFAAVGVAMAFLLIWSNRLLDKTRTGTTGHIPTRAEIREARKEKQHH